MVLHRLLLALLARPVAPLNPLGANIDASFDYSRTLAFADVMKQARPFGSAPAPWDGNCSTHPDGWPSQSDFGVVFATLGASRVADPNGVDLSGVWRLSFSGACASVAPAASGGAFTVTGVAYAPAADLTTASLNYNPSATTSQIMLAFRGCATRARRGAGAANISLLQPGHAPTDVFSRPLLALLRGFDVLRFMDQGASPPPISSWGDRTLPCAPSYAARGTGLPWEVLVELAVAVNVSQLWVNVPAHADDDYIGQLGALLAGAAPPSTAILVEYGNELWNFQFESTLYNLRMANESVVLDGDPFHFNYDGVNNTGLWAIRRVPYMLKRIVDLWRPAFPPGTPFGRNGRVRPVYAAQIVNFGGVSDGVKYMEAVWGPAPLASTFHALSGAPYAPIGPAAASPALTPQQVLDGWGASVAAVTISSAGVGGTNYVAPFAALAGFHGLELLAYEGGVDTVEGINAGPPLWAKANASADPRVAGIVGALLAAWAEHGGMVGAFNWFSLGAGVLQNPFGIYDVLVDMRVLSSAKLDGLRAFRAAPPVPPSPALPALPCLLNASLYAGNPTGAAIWFPSPNSSFLYLVNGGAGSAGVGVTLHAGNAGGVGVEVEVSVGAGARARVACPPTGGWASPQPCARAQLPFAAGVNVFGIKFVAGFAAVTEVVLV